MRAPKSLFPVYYNIGAAHKEKMNYAAARILKTKMKENAIMEKEIEQNVPNTEDKIPDIILTPLTDEEIALVTGGAYDVSFHSAELPASSQSTGITMLGSEQ